MPVRAPAAVPASHGDRPSRPATLDIADRACRSARGSSAPRRARHRELIERCHARFRGRRRSPQAAARDESLSDVLANARRTPCPANLAFPTLCSGDEHADAVAVLATARRIVEPTKGRSSRRRRRARRRRSWRARCRSRALDLEVVGAVFEVVGIVRPVVGIVRPVRGARLHLRSARARHPARWRALPFRQPARRMHPAQASTAAASVDDGSETPMAAAASARRSAGRPRTAASPRVIALRAVRGSTSAATASCRTRRVVTFGICGHVAVSVTAPHLHNAYVLGLTSECNVLRVSEHELAITTTGAGLGAASSTATWALTPRRLRLGVDAPQKVANDAVGPP